MKKIFKDEAFYKLRAVYKQIVVKAQNSFDIIQRVAILAHRAKKGGNKTAFMPSVIL